MTRQRRMRRGSACLVHAFRLDSVGLTDSRSLDILLTACSRWTADRLATTAKTPLPTHQATFLHTDILSMLVSQCSPPPFPTTYATPYRTALRPVSGTRCYTCEPPVPGLRIRLWRAAFTHLALRQNRRAQHSVPTHTPAAAFCRTFHALLSTT